jgi:phage terminase small subunit
METAELLVSGRNQILYMNPLFNVMANLEASVIKNASRLGLDTAARVRAKIKEATKKSDAFAEFAKKSPGRRTLDEAEQN